MRIWLQWLALVVICVVLIVADSFHMATIYYNSFLIMLLAMTTALVLLFKALHKNQQ